MPSQTRQIGGSRSAWRVSALVAVCLAAALASPFAVPAPPPRGAPSAAAAGVVSVVVQPVAAVAGREVVVGQVASIEGGDKALRERIAALDLADVPAPGKTTHLAQEVIAYRIRIAGIDARRVQVQGAKSVAVSARGERVSEDEILAAAREFLLARVPWDSADVTIEPAQPVRGPVMVPGDAEDVRLDVRLRGGRIALGPVRLDVAVYAQGAKQAEIPVTLELRLHQLVAVASRRIDRGQPLTEENVYFERRAVDTAAAFLSESESPVGQRARRPILPLQVITRLDVEAAEPASAIVIRQRDLVQIVARAGRLTVTAAGEALQDGRPGQAIRVRNVDSKAVVTGRVISRDKVQVLY